MSTESKRGRNLGAPKISTAKWVDVDIPRGEFARNGPLMNLIIEYLLNHMAAFTYGIQFPEVKILGKIGANCSVTAAACWAIKTHNHENVLVLKECHGDKIEWPEVFGAAVEMGSVRIARQLEPLCVGTLENGDMHAFMRGAAARGHTALMHQLLLWAVKNVDCAASMRETALCFAARAGNVAGFRKAAELGACGMGDALCHAASGGKVGMLRRINAWAAENKEWHIPFDTKLQAFNTAVAAGSVRAARCILEMEPGLSTVEFLADALNHAVLGGHVPICEFLLSCMTIEGKALHECKCDDGYENKVPVPWPALRAAVKNGSVPLMRMFGNVLMGPPLFLGIPPSLLNELLGTAASYDRTSASKLLRHWGAYDFDGMLRCATFNEAPRCMALAAMFGAQDFEGALDGLNVATGSNIISGEVGNRMRALLAKLYPGLKVLPMSLFPVSG